MSASVVPDIPFTVPKVPMLKQKVLLSGLSNREMADLDVRSKTTR